MIDPQRYVVRVSESQWAVLPFSETVCEPLSQGAYEPLSRDETLAAVAGLDISLVADPQEWDVDWRRAGDLGPADLDGCAVLSSRRSRPPLRSGGRR